MKIEQILWTESTKWESDKKDFDRSAVQWVLAFGDRDLLENAERFAELKQMYPNAHILMASTSGNIIGIALKDQCITATAVCFERPLELRVQRINVKEAKEGFSAGAALAKKMPAEGLVHLFVISDGHLVNGTSLIKGILSEIQNQVKVTGGLAGDGDRFKKTLVGIDAPPKEGEIVCMGFYGQHLKVGFGSYGGWDPIGIERKITRSSSNILYELDGKSALDLYKTYLGEQAKELPSSALFFPLAIRPNSQSKAVVRTILSINAHEKTMHFAGDMPQGWYAQLMKANFERLIDGASQAAKASCERLGKQGPELGILISCVGRRLILGPRSEEEIEAVQEILGKNVIFTGFYSYGEICPALLQANCELHNQTMTITTLSEYE